VSWLGYDIGAALSAEAGRSIDGTGAFGAEEIGHGEAGATILTEFAGRAHTAAGGTGNGSGIARGAEARESSGCEGGIGGWWELW
jgi:hypothetical protein